VLKISFSNPSTSEPEEGEEICRGKNLLNAQNTEKSELLRFLFPLHLMKLMRPPNSQKFQGYH
jgi:hypothetical protein